MQQIKKSISSKKVFVGMSGGVDSSVSAALLKEQGFDVTGVFIKVWSPDWLPCTWKDERRDAMRVAAHLNIPLITFDFEKEYKKEVVDYMIEEYKRGRTPNPDVMCNKEVKFGMFLQKALALGADYVATGHYAQNVEGKLLEGKDQNKDQSYFLWTLTQSQLKHILFPVGHVEKKEVRNLAKKFDLPTALKKDSQGICFIGKVEMKEFLQHYIDKNPGNVLDEEGAVIGTHEGAVFYTVGQRHGFTINKKTSADEAYYVTKKDIQHNTVTVSHKHEESKKNNHTVIINAVNSISELSEKNYVARIRYRQEKQVCTVGKIDATGYKITFLERQEGVSVGQSVVIYSDNECVGGGVIDQVI